MATSTGYPNLIDESSASGIISMIEVGIPVVLMAAAAFCRGKKDNASYDERVWSDMKTVNLLGSFHFVLVLSYFLFKPVFAWSYLQLLVLVFLLALPFVLLILIGGVRFCNAELKDKVRESCKVYADQISKICGNLQDFRNMSLTTWLGTLLYGIGYILLYFPLSFLIYGVVLPALAYLVLSLCCTIVITEVHEIAKEENAQPGFQISQALIMALYYTVCFIPELILLSLNELNAPKLGLQPFPPYIMMLVFDGLMLMFTIALFCRGNRVKQTQVEPQETETPVDVERQNLLPNTDIAQNANLPNVQLGEDAGNQARPNTAQGLIEMRPIEMRPIDRKQVMDEADDLDEPLWMNPAPVKGASVSRVQQAFRLGEIRPSRVHRTEPKEASSDYSALNDTIGFDHIGSSRATGSNQSENKKYECGICLSTDKRPFAFNCFHVVCESCAETLSISPGKCPYCQQQILAKHPIFL